MNEEKKIIVRSIREEDLSLILKWRTDPEITKYMITDPELNMDIQKEWFRKIKEDRCISYWMIEVDNQPAGVINLIKIHNSGKWGYYMGEKHLRSFSAAISLECSLYDYVFDTLGLEKICNEVLSINRGVIKLHEYCGNTVTEVVKGGVVKHGESYDLVMMELSRDVWMETRAKFFYSKIDFTEKS